MEATILSQYDDLKQEFEPKFKGLNVDFEHQFNKAKWEVLSKNKYSNPSEEQIIKAMKIGLGLLVKHYENNPPKRKSGKLINRILKFFGL